MISAKIQGAVAAGGLALVVLLAGAAGVLVHDGTGHSMGADHMQDMVDMAHAGDARHARVGAMDHGPHGGRR